MKSWRCIVACVIAASASGSAAAQSPSIRGVGDLPGGQFLSNVGGVSADGKVVVGLGTTGPDMVEAFRWTAVEGMRGLGTLPGQLQSWGQDVSGDGRVIVGISFAPQTTPDKAFRWTESGGMQFVGALPGATVGSHAYSISFDGSVIVGTGDSTQGRQGYRWTQAAGMQALGELPGGGFDSFARKVSGDGTTAVGFSSSANGLEAFRWTAAGGMQGLGDLAGGPFESDAMDVSADGGVIVGTGRTAQGFEAFRWTAAGGITGLGFLPGDTSSSAAVISPDGTTMFGGSTGPGGSTSVVWDSARGVRDLRAFLTQENGVDLGGWTGLFVTDVSADGMTLVGDGVNPAGNREGFVVTVPEPTGAAALLLAALAAVRRRRPYAG